MASCLVLTQRGPGLVIKIFHQREGLDGSSRLGGDDEKAAGKVETPGAGQDGAGVGGVEDGELRTARPDAENMPEGLRGETGPPHAEERDIGVAVLPDSGDA